MKKLVLPLLTILIFTSSCETKEEYFCSCSWSLPDGGGSGSREEKIGDENSHTIEQARTECSNKRSLWVPDDAWRSSCEMYGVE